MTKQKDAATPTATATTKEHTAKLGKKTEKSKFSYMDLLDRIMRFSYDSESKHIQIKDGLKNDIRISEAIAKAHHTLPTDCLPSKLQKIVTQFAAENETCSNYIITNMLVVAGSAVGSNLNIKDESYENLPVLFACLVGPPSAGKTPSMRPVIQPLEGLDKEHYKQFRAEHAAWKRAKDASIPEPHCEQIIIKDTTPEGIIKVHDQNRRGVLIHADEATQFFRNIDKYSGGDFIPSLSGSWAGDAIKVTRKSEDSPVFIDNPFISLLCGIQPGKLKETFKQYIDNGFDQRFLFVSPNDPKQRTTMDYTIHAQWKNIIVGLWRRTPTTVLFDNDASCFLEKFNSLIRELAKECEDEGNSVFSEWLLKQNYNVRRIAGILHVLDGNNMSNTISLPTVQKSIRLAISYGYHFLRFLDVINERLTNKMRIGEALKMVIEKYKIFEDVKGRKKYTLNSFATKVLGIAQSTLYDHLNKCDEL